MRPIETTFIRHHVGSHSCDEKNTAEKKNSLQKKERRQHISVPTVIVAETGKLSNVEGGKMMQLIHQMSLIWCPKYLVHGKNLFQKTRH